MCERADDLVLRRDAIHFGEIAIGLSTVQPVVSGSDSELDPITVDAHVIGQLRGCRRTAGHAAVGEPESAAVPWADQAIALDAALVQRPAVVAAGGAHGM
jgi:hypothetical protein